MICLAVFIFGLHFADVVASTGSSCNLDSHHNSVPFHVVQRLLELKSTSNENIVNLINDTRYFHHEVDLLRDLVANLTIELASLRTEFSSCSCLSITTESTVISTPSPFSTLSQEPTSSYFLSESISVSSSFVNMPSMSLESAIFPSSSLSIEGSRSFSSTSTFETDRFPSASLSVEGSRSFSSTSTFETDRFPSSSLSVEGSRSFSSTSTSETDMFPSSSLSVEGSRSFSSTITSTSDTESSMLESSTPPIPLRASSTSTSLLTTSTINNSQTSDVLLQSRTSSQSIEETRVSNEPSPNFSSSRIFKPIQPSSSSVDVSASNSASILASSSSIAS